MHASDGYCRSAIKSPQILELSGIGRKDVLSKIGVDVKIELPGVGENVQVYFESLTTVNEAIYLKFRITLVQE